MNAPGGNFTPNAATNKIQKVYQFIFNEDMPIYLYIYVFIYSYIYSIPIEPHDAAAEVSKGKNRFIYV